MKNTIKTLKAFAIAGVFVIGTFSITAYSKKMTEFHCDNWGTGGVCIWCYDDGSCGWYQW